MMILAVFFSSLGVGIANIMSNPLNELLLAGSISIAVTYLFLSLEN